MAFTDGEKYKIVRFLGWPANTIVTGSIGYSKIFSDHLVGLATEAETEVRSILTRIGALDTSLATAINQAGVKKIDDIEFFGAADGGTKTDELRRERRRLIKELSSLLDIAVMGGGGMGNVSI